MNFDDEQQNMHQHKHFTNHIQTYHSVLVNIKTKTQLTPDISNY